MKRIVNIAIFLIFFAGTINAQEDPFKQLNFALGEWKGEGVGFGNAKSTINSCFQFVMNSKYIEVTNESKFEPTEKKPSGEYHMDKGYISYDKQRKVLVFRQFHIEGFVNQYIYSESQSDETTVVFESEAIENFVTGGKARWTIKKISDSEIETCFDLAMPGKEYTRYGTNRMTKR